MVTTAMAVGPSSVLVTPRPDGRHGPAAGPEGRLSVVAGERVLPALTPGAVLTPDRSRETEGRSPAEDRGVVSIGL